jgi:outer membrane protein OmpA-like peptidoglycan-associated protein
LYGCTLQQRSDEPAQGGPSRESFAPRKVVQLGFGRDAVFATCIEPACPITTQKTVASTQAIASSAVAVVVDSGPTASKAVRAVEISSVSTHAHIAAAPLAPQQRALVLFFRSSGATLTESAKAALDELLPLASNAARVMIAGRTDNTGSDSANRAVALTRANAVRDYLRANLTLPDEAFVIDAQGSCCYIASNDTPEGRKQNRRVEIVLSVPEQVTP